MLKTLRGPPAPLSSMVKRPSFRSGLFSAVSSMLQRNALPAKRSVFDSFAYAPPRAHTPLPPYAEAVGSLRSPARARANMLPRLYPKLPSYDEVVATRYEAQQSLGADAGKDKLNELLRRIYPDPRTSPRGSTATTLGMRTINQPTGPVSGRVWESFQRANMPAATMNTMAQRAATEAMRRALDAKRSGR